MVFSVRLSVIQSCSRMVVQQQLHKSAVSQFWGDSLSLEHNTALWLDGSKVARITQANL